MAEDSRTIAIAIDDSDHSEYAFDFYADNIHRQCDRIVLLHVPEYSNILSASSLLTDPNIISEMLKDTEERTTDLVQKFSIKLKDKQMCGHVKQQCGKPGEAIVEGAKEEGATLLILGSRGMGKSTPDIHGQRQRLLCAPCPLPHPRLQVQGTEADKITPF